MGRKGVSPAETQASKGQDPSAGTVSMPTCQSHLRGISWGLPEACPPPYGPLWVISRTPRPVAHRPSLFSVGWGLVHLPALASFCLFLAHGASLR